MAAAGRGQRGRVPLVVLFGGAVELVDRVRTEVDPAPFLLVDDVAVEAVAVGTGFGDGLRAVQFLRLVEDDVDRSVGGRRRLADGLCVSLAALRFVVAIRTSNSPRSVPSALRVLASYCPAGSPGMLPVITWLVPVFPVTSSEILISCRS